jgi:hypothetical protein
MTGVRDSAGVLRTISSIQVRDAAGDLRTVSKIEMRDADNVLREVAGGGFGFSATASPDSSIGYGFSETNIIVTTTTTVVVSATGGVPPYTYSWVAAEADWEAVFPTSQSTTFRSPYLAPGEDLASYFTCTVTDSTAATTDANPVLARARNLA